MPIEGERIAYVRRVRIYAGKEPIGHGDTEVGVLNSAITSHADQE